jgi:hypothetical protein
VEGGAVEEADAVHTGCEGREGLGGRMGTQRLHELFLIVRERILRKGIDHAGS